MQVARDDEAPGSRHFSVGRVIKAAFSHNRATRARKSSRLRSMTTSNSNPALDASSVRQRCSGSDREGEECVTGTDVRSPQDDLGQAQPVPLAVSQGASIGAFGRIRGPVGESMDADWGGHEGDSSGRGNDLSGHGREEAEEDGGEEGGEEGEEEGGEEGGEDSDREDERLRRMRMAMARGMFAGNGRSLLRSERVSFRVENDGRVAGWRRGSSASSGEMEGRPKEDHVGRFIAMQRSAMPLSLRVRLYIYAFREWMKSVDAVHGCMLLFLVLVVAHGALLALYVRSSGDAPSSSDGVPAIDAAVVGLASLSGWVSLLYFGRASRRWGHLVVIAIECVGDILRFAGIFLLFLLGFSFAFVVLVSPRSDLAELRAAKAMQYYGTRMWAVFTVSPAVAAHDISLSSPARSCESSCLLCSCVVRGSDEVLLGPPCPSVSRVLRVKPTVYNRLCVRPVVLHCALRFGQHETSSLVDSRVLHVRPGGRLPSVQDQWSTLMHAPVAATQAAWTSDVGAWDADLATHDPEHQWLGYALIVLFGAMIILLLFNIIIAMMASTFARVQEMSEETWHLQWARLLIQTERRLPRALR